MFLRIALLTILLVCSTNSSVAAHDEDYGHKHDLSDLINLSIEDLEKLKVTSVSRKAESKFRAASSISVLTKEDIRRSGFTSIPEALRMVPGVNVARVDSNKWSISVRGFNRMFSNKLLVLIDGRTVYTPLVSGVYWDTQDLNFEDLDRIEVIKGPGAAMWGSNAVNGVINIITKNAAFTQGNHVSVIKGDYHRGTVSARHGGQFSDDLFYRVYAKHSSYNETDQINSDLGIDDDWYFSRAGFRLDWNKSGQESFQLQSEIHSGREQQQYSVPGLVANGVSGDIDADDNITGGHILGSWKRQTHIGGEEKLQLYVDYKRRDTSNVLNQSILTFDVDYQNLWPVNERNELIWGLGYRFFHDNLNDLELSNGVTYVDYEPERTNNNLFSAFVQNEYAMVPNELFLTLGSKFEHNYYTDFEIQPNARIAWHIDDTNTMWAAVSRAIRIPTRSERSLSSVLSSRATGFVRLSASSDRNFDSEKLTAFEWGYRTQPSWWSLIDLSLFYNKYDELRTFEAGTSAFGNPNTALEGIAENLGYAETYGIELATRFTLRRNWNVFLNYSFLEMEMHTKKSSRDTSLAGEETRSPEQQINLLSRLNVTPYLMFDSNIFYVDQLASQDIDDYLRVDTSVHVDFSDRVKLSLVGQDLFDSGHQESVPNLYSRKAEFGRSVFARLSVDF